jgi:hypothetical protein
MSNDICAQFPYSIPYFDRVMEASNFTLTTKDMLEITYRIQDWLSEYVRCNGKNNYKWTDSTDIVGIFINDLATQDFYTVLRFRFQEDLLAFQIRFGLSK